MTDQELLKKINAFYSNLLFISSVKQAVGAEARRAYLIKEAHRRGIIGMKSKRKFREV